MEYIPCIIQYTVQCTGVDGGVYTVYYSIHCIIYLQVNGFKKKNVQVQGGKKINVQVQGVKIYNCVGIVLNI